MNSTSSTEADFKLEELFFSKTDKKGHIQASNSVFVRVSEFPEEELLYRPHNVVRHPDMPKTVFKLLWSNLLAERAMAAYVKNKSKSGKYYWVFAMAFPMKDGFLSIRLKPTSKFFAQIKELYSQLLLQEQDGMSLDQGVAWILQKLKDAGFSSYEDFMMRALVAELESRDTLMTGEVAPSIKNTAQDRRLSDRYIASTRCTDASRNGFRITNQLYGNLEKLTAQTNAISKTCRSVKFVTTNMTISSAKLGESGRPLGVVSLNLEKLSSDISACVGALESALKVFDSSVLAMHSMLGTSRFQIEMMHHFIKEAMCSNLGVQGEQQILQFVKHCSLLNELVTQNFIKVEQSSTDLDKVSKSLLTTIERLSQVTAGMDVIRIVGKIEVARISDLSDELSSRLAEIEELTNDFKSFLGVLESECLWGTTCAIRITHLTKDISERLALMTKIIAV
ncbi:MAG: PAS domain-containing protein [Bacillota bacterium]